MFKQHVRVVKHILYSSYVAKTNSERFAILTEDVVKVFRSNKAKIFRKAFTANN